MTELMLNSNTLPEPLFRMINTKKVMVNESGGIISLIPIADSKEDCPLLGLTADSGLNVEKFLALTHSEKEIRQ
jgi:hypothetical protein